MRRHRVFVYVQHLLGIGHLKRVVVIVRALLRQGLDTTVVSGGEPFAGIDFATARVVQLPPIRAADATFQWLVDDAGNPVDEACRQRRRHVLLAALEACQPDVILIELFPFGRRAFGFELLPLIEIAHRLRPRPAVASLVRDILVQKGDRKRRQEAIGLASTAFDAVLVHADPGLFRLTDSFPEATAITERLWYTGYVVDPTLLTAGDAPLAADAPVVVSAGGGAVGLGLLQASLDARRLSRAKDRRWRLITGPNLPAGARRSVLDQAAAAGLPVETWCSELATVWRGSSLSISQAGYNTLVELAAVRAPAVVVPFAEEGETEQSLRAGRFAARGLVTVLDASSMTPERLAAAIDQRIERRPPPAGLDLSGAETTARLVARLCEMHSID